jgi:hypothetical protein
MKGPHTMRSQSFEINNSHAAILVDASQICKWTYNLAMANVKPDVRIFENLDSLSQAAAIAGIHAANEIYKT